MDPVSVLLFIVVGVLTSLLTVVGVQAFLTLRKLGQVLEKVDGILEDARAVSGAVSRPIVGIANFVEGLKDFRRVIDVFTGNGEKKVKEEVLSRKESVESSAVSDLGAGTKDARVDEGVLDDSPPLQAQTEHEHITSMQERGRRFFHRGGKQLTS